MKVLHLTRGNLYGGVEKVLTTFARYAHVCPQMESHFALCFDGRSRQELLEADATVYDLGPVKTRFPWTMLRARQRLKAVLRANRFDIAVAHMSWPHAVFGSVIKAAGIPMLHWAHGPYSKPTDWVDRWAMRYRPEGIIANSRYTAKIVSGLFPEAVPAVITYPLPVRRGGQVTKARAEMRRELGVREESTVIVQVSRMDPWKGHQTHLDALGRLRDFPDWECWFIGGAQRRAEKRYECELRKRTAALGIADRVKFLGQRTNVSDYLAAADIFCQPNSEPEPYGIVYIEALEAGLPVVGSALGGAMEIVDSSCGCLIPAGDPAMLADLLSTLLASPSLRTALARNGPERAVALSDPVAQLGRVYDYLDRICTTLSSEAPSRRQQRMD